MVIRSEPPKLVRLIVARELWESGGRLPPGYEVVWHRDDNMARTRELLICGKFPPEFPDLALIDALLSIENDKVFFEWRYEKHKHKIEGWEL
jgi:hypothetical protein